MLRDAREDFDTHRGMGARQRSQICWSLCHLAWGCLLHRPAELYHAVTVGSAIRWAGRFLGLALARGSSPGPKSAAAPESGSALTKNLPRLHRCPTLSWAYMCPPMGVRLCHGHRFFSC